ncbi:major facilitator superfamily protein [mine drainage metagenome]|uniref:Major facilitator superfamily protein n=1 Tax=mine drainage metagenome TaxID=410659 RepID=A0A1J5QIF4_9ZZZZ
MSTSATDVETHGVVRKRTLRTLSIAQIIAGLGTAGAIPAGALLVLDISGSEAIAGLAQTFSVLGSALMAIPLANITQRGGRRAALSIGYGIGAVGALLTVLGGSARIFPLVFLGILLVGAASASGYQARFAATDLAEDRHRGRDLSYVVWAGTVGSVLGPNLVGTTSKFAHSIGMPRLTGPYLVAGAMLLVGALIIFFFLRPDPYLFSRTEAHIAQGRRKGSTRLALKTIRESKSASLALLAIVVGHIVMVSIMVMTPIHMHHYEASLTIIGLVISVHIAGMYAFSPVMGWLSDKLGPPKVILIGVLVLTAAAIIAGTAPMSGSGILGVGLFSLGLGWSETLVAGSSLLSKSVPIELRPAVQGASDLMMNGAGAVGGAVAGLIIAFASYGALCAICLVPVAALGISATRLIRSGE